VRSWPDAGRPGKKSERVYCQTLHLHKERGWFFCYLYRSLSASYLLYKAAEKKRRLKRKKWVPYLPKSVRPRSQALLGLSDFGKRTMKSFGPGRVQKYTKVVNQ